MKKLIIATLLCVGFSIYAQETTEIQRKRNKENNEMKSPENKNLQILTKLTVDLNLTATQQEQIKSLIAEQSTNISAMRAKQKTNKENNVQLSDAEKKEVRAKMKEEREATDAKIKNILTSEQYTKHQEIQNVQRKKMKSQQKPKADQ